MKFFGLENFRKGARLNDENNFPMNRAVFQLYREISWTAET
jgi:hypothetical protein